MLNMNSRLMAAAALSAALLAGCGGSDHADNAGSGGAPPGPVAQTITDVSGYITGLFAGNNDINEPVDINALTLVASDEADSAPLP
ncbi:MAG: hypothetical protein JWR74_2057 [Polaromonas sp.]|jgi:hypothetical protein|nr:hypothetical protein [Polaromonas sp.]